MNDLDDLEYYNYSLYNKVQRIVNHISKMRYLNINSIKNFNHTGIKLACSHNNTNLIITINPEEIDDNMKIYKDKKLVENINLPNIDNTDLNLIYLMYYFK